jgi:hypothetical protein
VVLFAVLGVAVIPTLALVLSSQPHWVMGGPPWLIVVCFSFIFMLMGGTTSGVFIGFKSYMLDIAPEARRPTYVGITNTVLGVGALYPIFGGVLADLVHLQGVFFLSAVTVFAGVWLSWGLEAPKVIENEV